MVTLKGSPRDPGFDLDELVEMGEHIESIAPKYLQYLNTTKMSVIDTGVLVHQVPGGMTSNLVSQLREAEALDRLNEVYKELPRTRKELGYPPLVTPTSQIVGIQAVQNVLFGRYKMMSDQIKDYLYGLYGRTPAPIDKNVQKKGLKGYSRGQTPTKKRPGDLLKPGMRKARSDTKNLARSEADVLIAALYPVTGKRFLRWKYGLEPVPDNVKPKTIADVERERELIDKALKGELVEPPDKEAPPQGPDARTFNVFVDGEYFEVAVDTADGSPGVQSITQPATTPRADESAAPRLAQAKPATARSKVVSKAATVHFEGADAVTAPMPGVIINVLVREGDSIAKGDDVVVLEAMKVENTLTAPADGKVLVINCKIGDSVKKGDALVQIG